MIILLQKLIKVRVKPTIIIVKKEGDVLLWPNTSKINQSPINQNFILIILKKHKTITWKKQTTMKDKVSMRKLYRTEASQKTTNKK